MWGRLRCLTKQTHGWARDFVSVTLRYVDKDWLHLLVSEWQFITASVGELTGARRTPRGSAPRKTWQQQQKNCSLRRRDDSWRAYRPRSSAPRRRSQSDDVNRVRMTYMFNLCRSRSRIFFFEFFFSTTQMAIDGEFIVGLSDVG